MSEFITDELREFAPHLDLGKVALAGWKESLLAIADRIDAEHERQLEVLYRDMSDAEYVKLPKDADGEYIHVGDVMEINGEVLPPVSGIGNGSVIVGVFGVDKDDDISEVFTLDLMRHRKPTVEDVLREFGDWYAHTKGGCDEAGIIAEYAAKLQLKESE